jgi:hypothetical protein
MFFSSFSELCPQIALEETRTFTILKEGELPLGTYILEETYCLKSSEFPWNKSRRRKKRLKRSQGFQIKKSEYLPTVFLLTHLHLLSFLNSNLIPKIVFLFYLYWGCQDIVKGMAESSRKIAVFGA